MTKKDRQYGKKLVMKPMFRMKVEKDKTKYDRKVKNKGRNSDLYSFWTLICGIMDKI
jgi:stalled ribosome alternative rescue factor ArfA